jgi:hypothetical protein
MAKKLNGVPHNLAASFLSTVAYSNGAYQGQWLYFGAKRQNISYVELDILNARITPEELKIDAVTRWLKVASQKQLESFLKQQGFSPDFVIEAKIKFFIDFQKGSLTAYPSMKDKEGKEYVGKEVSESIYSQEFDPFERTHDNASFLGSIGNISLDVTYTADDYYLARRIAMSKVLWLLFALIGITSLVVGGISISTGSLLGVGSLVLGFFFITYSQIGLRLTARYTFPGLGIKNPNHFLISENGVENTYGNGGSKYAWKDVVDVKHDNKILLIYIAKYQFFMIPHRAVSKKDWNALINLKNTFKS